MISSFDMTKLRALLRDFYTLTQIRITVFDDKGAELLAYPASVSDFCKIVRANPQGLAGCRECDRRACNTALQRRSTYIYRCHAGLTEAAAPIFLGNLIVGYLLFGHIFSYPTHEKGWETVSACCAKYDLPKESLRKSCNRLMPVSKPYIASAANLLRAVASYLCMERVIRLRQNDLPLQLDQYIQARLSQELSAETICRALGIGRTYLYELSRQSYGCGVAEHIRRLRIARAKELLVEEAELSISDVAEACGFPDYNYFITVFKKQTGTTPRQFRLSSASFRRSDQPS